MVSAIVEQIDGCPDKKVYFELYVKNRWFALIPLSRPKYNFWRFQYPLHYIKHILMAVMMSTTYLKKKQINLFIYFQDLFGLWSVVHPMISSLKFYALYTCCSACGILKVFSRNNKYKSGYLWPVWLVILFYVRRAKLPQSDLHRL